MLRFLILLTLLTSSLAQDRLPEGSQILTGNNISVHVHRMGVVQADQPAILLLSGPTDHWHSDSAWFALLQPLLAKQALTYTIDRPGQGFGPVQTQSYTEFGQELAPILHELQIKDLVIVAFASANLALNAYFSHPHPEIKVRAVLLIDPDTLDPWDAHFYAVQAQPFQDPKLKDYVLTGKYDERAVAIQKEEREHVNQIIPPHLQSQMDWHYFDQLALEQLKRERIAERFAEIAHYDSDVANASKVPWPAHMVTAIWDTEFELAEIAHDPANKDLPLWREKSTQWMKQLAGRCYYASSSQEHGAIFAEADKLAELIMQLANEKVCQNP